MVRTLTSSAEAIPSSTRAGPPSASSAWSRIRAWANLRASALPREIIRRRSSRSSAVNVTRYLFATAIVPPVPIPTGRTAQPTRQTKADRVLDQLVLARRLAHRPVEELAVSHAQPFRAALADRHGHLPH